jgi:hypothetical protein
MSIENEIFDAFFSELKNAELPDNLISKIQKLWKANKLASKSNILATLLGEQKNENKGKKC